MAFDRLQITGSLLVCLIALGGCHARPGVSRYDARPIYQGGHGQPVSLALPSERLSAAGYGESAYEPWYAGRNDLGPSVFAGYESVSYESAVTYTRDRQYISGGRVYDRYDQTTYRRTYRESSR